MREYHIRPREAALESIGAYLTSHNLRPGDRLPSERDMCDMWSLNRCTLRSAVDRLERDGVLASRRGAGIYVLEPKFRRNLQDLHSFTEEGRRQNREISTRLISLSEAECDKQLARRFQVVLGAPLWKLSRLRLAEGKPLLLETSFFLRDRFPGIDALDLEGQSLYVAFQDQYGVTPTQGEEKISITGVTDEESELLDVASGSPAFWIVSQTYDETGALLEYCRTVARGDRVVLTSVLERRASN